MTAEENATNVALFRKIVAEQFPSEKAQIAASRYSDPEHQLIAKLTITTQEYPDDSLIEEAMNFAKPLTGVSQVKKALEIMKEPDFGLLM